MKSFLKKEVVFEANVDFGYDLKNQRIYLTEDREHKSYDVNIKIPSPSQVSSCASNVILSDIPQELNLIYGIKVKTRVITTRMGSLSIFFGALITGYTLIGSYKSFLDSIELMKEHLRKLLERKFKQEFDIEDWNIDIENRFPSSRVLRFDKRLREIIMHGDVGLLEEYAFSDDYEHFPRRKRDGFFYYLLIANIVLLIIIGILIFEAIQKTYFM